MKAYSIGFVISVLLTLAAYYLVTGYSSGFSFPGLTLWSIAGAIAVLALAQAAVQLFFFMHIRLRGQPRWRLTIFLFMAMVVLILVGGSIWIMSSLSGRMAMTPDQVDQYMQDQAGI